MSENLNKITGYKKKHEYTNKNGITSTVYLMDCMEGMAQFPDKYFDLAVVDPPYGIGAGSKGFTNRNTANKNAEKFYRDNDWDKVRPTKDYFDELKRISKNKIVWGGNYFTDFLEPARCYIVWDKKTGDNSYADCELALTNIDGNARIYTKFWLGAHAKDESDRIHPTQKPVALYDWIFYNYIEPNQKIIDTHLGSGSSRIAADKANLYFTGFEIDEEYFDASVKRFENYASQLKLF